MCATAAPPSRTNAQLPGCDLVPHASTGRCKPIQTMRREHGRLRGFRADDPGDRRRRICCAMIWPGRASGRGSISTDQRSRLSTSFSVTVITSVLPSMSTRPKNCRPKQGARFSPLQPLLEHRFRPERIVERGRRPGARMQRAGDELPERFEILIGRAVRIVRMRRRCNACRRSATPCCGCRRAS